MLTAVRHLPGPWQLVAAVLLLLCVSSRADALTDVAQRIADAESELGAIWPGFWPAGQPFLLYQRNGSCVLVSRTPPQSGFSADENDPRLWHGRCEGWRFRPAFLLEQSFGGIAAPAVRVGRRWAPSVAEPLLHEAFHIHQAVHFAHVRHATLRFDLPARRDLVELKLHETALLIGALAHEERAERRRHVHLAQSLRAHRLARMDPVSASVEDHFMRVEGSAEWVGIAARRALEPTLRDAAELRSRWRMLDDSAGATWERLLRWQSYHSGAAALSLLETEGLEWRQPLAAGAPPWQLLAEAFGASTLAHDEALAAAQRLNRWADIPRLATELGRIERRSERALQRFEGHRGHSLELLGPSRSFEIAFTARDIHSIGDGILIGDANPLVVESAWFRMDARRRPFRVLDLGRQLVLLLSGAPRVEGCPGDGTRTCPAGSVISGRGFELTLTAPTRLEPDGRILRLQAEAGDAQR
jgi:hypothetical protein